MISILCRSYYCTSGDLFHQVCPCEEDVLLHVLHSFHCASKAFILTPWTLQTVHAYSQMLDCEKLIARLGVSFWSTNSGDNIYHVEGSYGTLRFPPIPSSNFETMGSCSEEHQISFICPWWTIVCSHRACCAELRSGSIWHHHYPP